MNFASNVKRVRRVEVLQKDDGPVIVYLFPRTKEITKDDRKILFEAEIGSYSWGSLCIWKIWSIKASGNSEPAFARPIQT